MPEVLVSNDDITVLGPPEVVEILTDFGATGQRGSQVFVGLGNPNSISIGQTPELNDLYINTSPGSNYGYMYQYMIQPGGETWVEVLKISPTIYSSINETTYISGDVSISIPIANITSETGLSADNFCVRYSTVHTNPVATSMEIPALVGDEDTLVINLHSAEFNGTTWSALDETVTTHLFISIVV